MENVRALLKPYIDKISTYVGPHINKIIKKAPAEAWGLDIGKDCIKLVKLNPAGGQVKLFGFWHSMIDASQADKKAAVISAIRDVMGQANLTGGPVHLAMDDETVEVRRISVPYMPENELRNALKWEAHDVISLNLDQDPWDFAVIGEKEDQDGAKKAIVLIAAAKKALIDEIISIVKEVGLTPASINITPFCLWSAIKLQKGELAADTIAIVDIGASKTNISIFKNGTLEFTRQVKVGGSTITEAMSGVLVSDRGRLEISIPDAERIKKEHGIPDEGTNEVAGEVALAQLLPMVRPILERLVSEIKRSFDYYSSQFDGNKVKHIILTGGGGELKKLDKFLSNYLGIEVKRMPVPVPFEPEAAKAEKERPSGDCGTFATALGAAIGGDKGVNLLPHEFRVKKAEFIQKVSLRMVAVTVTALFLVSYLFISLQVGNLRAQIRQTGDLNAVISEVEAINSKLVQRKQLFSEIKKGETLMVELLKELSNITPASIIFDNFSFQKTEGRVAIKGVAFSGGISSESNLAEFIKQLEESPFTRSVSLTRSRQSDKFGSGARDFELSWTLITM